MSESFRALGVSAEVEQQLASRGILEPFRIQSLVVPDALAGRDILGRAPTGSGKTLAFGLPLVERTPADVKDTPAALILVPTRELASQVTEELAADRRAEGPPRGGRLRRRPGRPAGQAPAGRPDRRRHARPPARPRAAAHALASTASRRLVLDEADRMLDMGFLPQVERIVRHLPAKRQTMLFSATLDGEVGELARAYTTNPSRFEADLPDQHSHGDVEHEFVAVTAADKLDRLVELLQAQQGVALVFCRTKRGVDRLAVKLRARGVEATAMHGDMTQGAREKALERFRSGKVSTLVATDVAARGLDLESISHVINYDPPDDSKGYVHRVGRTGRAGRSGNGITLVLPEQQDEVSRVANMLGHREQFEATGMKTARAKLVYTSRRGRRSRW